MYLTKTRTDRGFQLITFKDSYDQKCSIQESSNLKHQIWVGADDVSFDEKDEPFNSRMCLSRKDSLRVSWRLFIFSLTGKVYQSKRKKVNNKLKIKQM